jgi:hypothetical protein
VAAARQTEHRYRWRLQARDAGAFLPRQQLDAAAAGSREGGASVFSQQLLVVACNAGQMAGSQDASTPAEAAVLFCAT